VPSGQDGVLYDAVGLHEFDVALLDLIARRRRLKGRAGNAVAWRGPLLRTMSRSATAALESASLKAAQRHTSVRYGERYWNRRFSSAFMSCWSCGSLRRASAAMAITGWSRFYTPARTL